MQKKKQYANRNDKRNQTVRRDDASQLLRLERGPSEVLYQEEGSHSPVAEAPAIVYQAYECESKRISSFVMEFTDILLQVAKHGD